MKNYRVAIEPMGNIMGEDGYFMTAYCSTLEEARSLYEKISGHVLAIADAFIGYEEAPDPVTVVEKRVDGEWVFYTAEMMTAGVVE